MEILHGINYHLSLGKTSLGNWISVIRFYWLPPWKQKCTCYNYLKIEVFEPFKDEAQTALFKDPFRTAQ